MDAAPAVSLIEATGLVIGSVCLAVLLIKSGIFMWKSILRRLLS